MAPRGRKRKIGLRREDAARDHMKELGFDKRVINESIKQVLKVYDDENPWFLIEDGNYKDLLDICIEKQKELDNKLAAEGQEEMAREEQEEMAQEEQDEEKEADALPITDEPVMDSSPPVEASVDYAHHSVGGTMSSHCGWLSSEEEKDPDEDSDGDDDDMIQLTPEPLCEELEELLREAYERKKMKYN